MPPKLKQSLTSNTSTPPFSRRKTALVLVAVSKYLRNIVSERKIRRERRTTLLKSRARRRKKTSLQLLKTKFSLI